MTDADVLLTLLILVAALLSPRWDMPAPLATSPRWR
jgi:hypothetical protein